MPFKVLSDFADTIACLGAALTREEATKFLHRHARSAPYLGPVSRSSPTIIPFVTMPLAIINLYNIEI